MGKVATSPLPPRGSPPLQSGGQNHKGPKMGRVVTPPLPPRGSPLLQSGGQNQKCPKKGGNATSPLHYGGSRAKGTKSKVAELGARTKLWMCSPKEHREKKFAQMMCVRRKTPLKPPLGPFYKKGGVFQPPPPLSDFSEPPPLLVGKSKQKSVSLCRSSVLVYVHVSWLPSHCTAPTRFACCVTARGGRCMLRT